METRGISSSKKRILLISLFIVPFLVGMALIFMAKGIGTLPFLHPVGKVMVDGKEKDLYYKVSSFSAKSFAGDSSFDFSNQDSSVFLICLFEEKRQEEWEKHLMYISKIVKRYNNVKVLAVYENDPKLFSWKEDPLLFINRHSNWYPLQIQTTEFLELVVNLKLERNEETGLYPYVIVDKEKHIRAYCPINDLKVARDVPKLLKILNNQYAPRKIEVTKKAR